MERDTSVFDYKGHEIIIEQKGKKFTAEADDMGLKIREGKSQKGILKEMKKWIDEREQIKRNDWFEKVKKETGGWS